MQTLTRHDIISAMFWAQEDVKKTREFVAQAEAFLLKYPGEAEEAESLAYWKAELPKAEARMRRFTDAANNYQGD